MKKALLFFVLAVSLQISKAQYVYVPDANFRTFLQTYFPDCMQGTDLDTTCPHILDTTSLTLQDMSSINVIRYFKNLEELILYNVGGSTFTFPDNKLRILRCGYNSFTSLPALPHIVELNCASNFLSSLPVLSDSIKYLDCSWNSIHNLPIILSTSQLEELWAQVNYLSTIPQMPPTLKVLNVTSNNVYILPPFPDSIQTLFIGGNQLSSLPPLPSALKDFRCGTNLLSAMPDLPKGVTYFSCEDNRLSSLPVLPAGINEFLCYDNYLISLPKLPDSLTHLDCHNNQLTSLPALTDTLLDLNCSQNHLLSLPSLPQHLFNLLCETNMLTSLPALPNSLRTLNCKSNPLGCLPIIPQPFYYLYLRNTFVHCIPSAGFVSADTTLPNCTTGPGICPVNPYIHGTVFNDVNNNGIFDTLTEMVLPHEMVTVSPGHWVSMSDLQGAYFAKLDTVVSNSITCSNNIPYGTVTTATYSLSNLHVPGSILGKFDFGIHFPPNISDLETVLSASRARPGFFVTVTLTINNRGTKNETAMVKLKTPAQFVFDNSSVPLNAIIGDTLFWNAVDIPFMESRTINIQLQVPTETPLGTLYDFEAWATTAAEDTTPADNYMRWEDSVRGSFDPNDKQVNKKTLLPGYDITNDRLIYTIRFQNTGNALAYTVIVKDVIPDNLDMSSLRVTSASHPYLLTVRDHNIVEVAFPDIQLPDSNSDEKNSHGFVQLSFRPLSGLPLNTQIKNAASIYFDYNAAVITNTATTTVQIITGIASNKKLFYRLFPNPSSEKITVQLPVEGKVKWMLYDVNGKTILQDDVQKITSIFDINVNGISGGTYLLSVEMDGVISTSKVVVIK